MTTRDVGCERMRILAKFLRKTVKDEHFLMNVYWADEKSVEYSKSVDRRGEYKHVCGFAGCALGWCPAVPEFRALGFINSADWHSPDPLGRKSNGVIYHGRHDIGAAMCFFALTRDEAEWLFLPGDNYGGIAGKDITREMVAARLDWLADGNAMENYIIPSLGVADAKS